MSVARAIGRDRWLTLAYACAMAIWLLLRPAPEAAVDAVDNVAQFAGPLLVLALVAGKAHRELLPSSGRTLATWAPLFLGLAVLCFSVGQVIWTFYGEVLNQAPFPSWADAGFLCVSPCVMVAIVLIPQVSMASRLRSVIDALLVAVALATFSWSFLLGPTIFEQGSPLATFVATAYPAVDLVAVCSLLVIFAKGDPPFRRRISGLVAAVAVVVATDVVNEVMQPRGSYQTGTLVDVGWPLGFMLLGLWARDLLCSPFPVLTTTDATPRVAPLWHFMIPYAFVTVAILGLGLAWLVHPGNGSLAPGLVLGCCALAGLIVFRQFLGVVDNRQMADVARHQAKHTEQLNVRLRAAQEEVQAVYSTMACGVVTVDPDGVVLDANDAALVMLGCRNGSDIRHSRLPDMLRTLDEADKQCDAEPPRAIDMLVAAIRLGQAQHGLTVRIAPSGRGTRWLLLDEVPLSSAQDGSMRYICTFVDVTQRIEAQAAAERLSDLRSDFLAAVSHELRTPLTAIIGYSEVLLGRWEQLEDVGRKGHVRRIAQAAERQQRLVEDLLLVSTIDAQHLDVHLERVDVAALLEQAVANLPAVYVGQIVQRDGPGGLAILADAQRTLQIVSSLLDNAAKYSEDGRPIEVTWQSEAATAVIRVRDHGCGVPDSERSQLFRRFGRVPGSRMRAGRVGTGLGLFLGRQLAQAMGGDLDLESTGSDGSTFCLHLPLSIADQAADEGLRALPPDLAWEAAETRIPVC